LSAAVVRPLRGDDSIAELTAPLHAAYAQLAAMGFNYTAVDQTDDVTRARIEGGDCYVAVEGGKIVGTILYHRHSDGCPWYAQPHVGVINQFGVSPSCQRGGIGTRLMAAAEARAAETGASELALDTSEGADHLIAWYGRLGYRFVEHVQWPGKTYRSVVMSKVLSSEA